MQLLNSGLMKYTINELCNILTSSMVVSRGFNAICRREINPSIGRAKAEHRPSIPTVATYAIRKTGRDEPIVTIKMFAYSQRI